MLILIWHWNVALTALTAHRRTSAHNNGLEEFRAYSVQGVVCRSTAAQDFLLKECFNLRIARYFDTKEVSTSARPANTLAAGQHRTWAPVARRSTALLTNAANRPPAFERFESKTASKLYISNRTIKSAASFTTSVLSEYKVTPSPVVLEVRRCA